MRRKNIIKLAAFEHLEQLLLQFVPRKRQACVDKYRRRLSDDKKTGVVIMYFPTVDGKWKASAEPISVRRDLAWESRFSLSIACHP